MKKLFIVLFVSLMLIGCSNVNNMGGDVGPQTKTITVINFSSYSVQLNEQTIAGGFNTEEVVLELGKTYDLHIPNGNPNILQGYVDCNVDEVRIGSEENGISVRKLINGNMSSPEIISIISN